MNGRQGTSRSKELDGKDSIERLGGEYHQESRGPAFSCTAAAGAKTAFPSVYKYSSILVLKGLVFYVQC